MRSSLTNPLGWLILVVVLGLSGCGGARYEERLAETKKLIEYQNKLNANLGRPWSEMNVTLRMPNVLNQLPNPEPAVDAEGNPVPAGPDPRQPAFMRVPLPGLLSAWQGSVGADVEGTLSQVPVYAYVMGNHEFWARGEMEDATVFDATVTRAVAEGLALELPQENSWKRENYPQGRSYVPPQVAQVWTERTSPSVFVDRTRAQVSLHLFQNGDMKLAVLFVVPLTIDPNERFDEKIELALQTLKLSSEKPATASGRGPARDANTGF